MGIFKSKWTHFHCAKCKFFLHSCRRIKKIICLPYPSFHIKGSKLAFHNPHEHARRENLILSLIHAPLFPEKQTTYLSSSFSQEPPKKKVISGVADKIQQKRKMTQKRGAHNFTVWSHQAITGNFFFLTLSAGFSSMKIKRV